MILTELFDKTVPFYLVGRSADFEVNGKTYLVSFNLERSQPGTVHVSFTLSNEDEVGTYYQLDISGTGDEIIVFSTVIAAIREYIRRNDPAIIMFTAKESEPSRIKLYDRMVKMFTQGYILASARDGIDKIYRLTKKQPTGAPNVPQ